LSEKFLCDKRSPYNVSTAVGYSLSTLKNSQTRFFLKVKTKFIFGEKGQSQTFILFYSIRLIDHSMGNKDAETSGPEFLGILPEFS